MLAYGSIAGGFLSDRWSGANEPASMNRSLQKYRLIIEEAGGWASLQALLHTLQSIADKHDVTISVVAARWVLDRPQVAAIILGTGRNSHTEQLADIRRLSLDSDDLSSIDECLQALKVPPGDTYDLERDPVGPHQAIIKTDLGNEVKDSA